MTSMDKKNERCRREIEVYRAFHQVKANQLTHAVGIPMILLALFSSFGWFRLSIENVPFSLGTLLFLGLSGFYLKVHRGLAIGFVIWSFPLFLLGEKVAVLPFAISFLIAVSLFVVGWGFQLLGHSIEKNQPAFMISLSHLWRGPLFITYKLMNSLGFKF